MSPKYDAYRKWVRITYPDYFLVCVSGSCLLICPENLPL